jgi:hypothetical protein
VNPWSLNPRSVNLRRPDAEVRFKTADFIGYYRRKQPGL